MPLLEGSSADHALGASRTSNGIDIKSPYTNMGKSRTFKTTVQGDTDVRR